MQRKSYVVELVQERTGRDPGELLRQLYVDQRRSQEEIAAHLGIGRGAVVALLNRYGITRDDRESLPPLAAAQ